MNMTHAHAMSQRQTTDRNDPNPSCAAALVDPNGYFADDVSWVAYTCPACRICIATVEGRAHWWNNVATPSPERAARIAHDAAAPATKQQERCQRCNAIIPDYGDGFERVLCDDCTAHEEAELAAQETVIERTYGNPFVRGVAIFGIAAALFGASPAHAADTLTAPRPINGRVYEWPYIGTPAYSDSCSITDFSEDGSALAYCWEDGARYAFDPDGQPVPNVPGNPVRGPGWYVVK